jgi:hypothetical protein
MAAVSAGVTSVHAPTAVEMTSAINEGSRLPSPGHFAESEVLDRIVTE